jgi:hypothetical protein
MLELLQTLALSGAIGGVIGGAVAGFRADGPLRFVTAFLVYLGLLAAVATTMLQSMDALPLTLVYGAAAGIVPFGAAFFLVRRLVSSLRSRQSRP